MGNDADNLSNKFRGLTPSELTLLTLTGNRLRWKSLERNIFYECEEMT